MRTSRRLSALLRGPDAVVPGGITVRPRRRSSVLAAVPAGMVAALILCLTFVSPAPARAAQGVDVARFLAVTNDQRAARGLAPLRSDEALSRVAAAWAAQMAGPAHLAHNPHLVADIDQAEGPHWTHYGENVGTGADVDSIQTAFINSPEHLRNIIDPAFSHVGIAVVYGANGAMWVVLDFLQPGVQAATAAPAAAARSATAIVASGPAEPPAADLAVRPPDPALAPDVPATTVEAPANPGPGATAAGLTPMAMASAGWAPAVLPRMPRHGSSTGRLFELADAGLLVVVSVAAAGAARRRGHGALRAA